MKEERTAYEEFASVYDMFMEDIPYEDMLAVYDKTGTEMSFGCFRGPSAKLITK